MMAILRITDKAALRGIVITNNRFYGNGREITAAEFEAAVEASRGGNEPRTNLQERV